MLAAKNTKRHEMNSEIDLILGLFFVTYRVFCGQKNL